MENSAHGWSLPRLWLYGGLVLFVLLWAFYPHQFTASDPWVYSHNAWKIAGGEFFRHPDNHPFSHRLGVTLPVAFFYKLFGVSILATHCWPLCCALLLVFTLWSALPDERSRKVGVVLCLTSVPFLKGSVVLQPDLIVAAFLGASSLLLHRRSRAAMPGVRNRAIPVVAVIALFIAFLAKLTAWWGLPLWLAVAILDVRRKERALLRTFYLPAAATALLLGAGYLLFCRHIWGSPFARIYGIEALAGEHLWAWKHFSANEQLLRLTLLPGLLFCAYYGLLFVFALLGIFRGAKQTWFWEGYTLCMVALFWFGGTSLSSYQPLPISGRMTLPVFPGLCIVAARFITAVAADLPRLSPRVSGRLVRGVLLCAAALPYFSYLAVRPWKTPAEMKAAQIIRREAESCPDRHVLLLCADVRSPESLAFYFAYRYPPNLHAVSMDSLTQTSIAAGDQLFLFLNEERSCFLQSAYGYTNYARHFRCCASAGMELVCGEDGVYVWRLSEPPVVQGNVCVH